MLRDTTANRVLLGTLLAGSLTVAAIDADSTDPNSPLAPVRAAAAGAFAPLQSAVVWLAAPITGTAADLSAGHTRTETIATLSATNMALAAQLRDLRTAQAEPAAGPQTDVLAARVIAVDDSARVVSVDRGRADGVRLNTAVLGIDGLIGRVSALTRHTATVLLLTDALSSVGVRSASTGQIGTLTGTGEALARLRMFDRHSAPAIGEELVTFGSRDSRPYPAGIPVGRVVSVQDTAHGPQALVRPYTRFGTLDAVGIVRHR